MQDGLAGKRVAEIVQADILETSLPTHLGPKTEIGRNRSRGIKRRRKDVGGTVPGLPGQDSLRLLAQVDPPCTRLAVVEVQGIAVQISRAQAHDFPPPTAGQQK